MTLRYSVIALLLALLLTLLVKSQTALNLLAAWLICGNLVTFFLYAYDKAIAQSAGLQMRIPERTLLLMALVGGAPGAWISMQLFRHKTSKRTFQQGFWLVVLIQLVVVVALLAVSR